MSEILTPVASTAEPWCSSEMGRPYSHPPEDGRDGVYLSDHLADVADRVSYIVSADTTTPAGESLVEVVESLAWVHDFGKATTYFQQYLGQRSGAPDDDRLRYHAPIGSFAAYYVLDARGHDTETCLAGFVAVAKHHGRLPDVAEYVHGRAHRRENVSGAKQSPAEEQQTAIWEQIGDIDEHESELAADVFENATGGAGTWAAFRDDFLTLLSEIEATVGTTGKMPGVRADALSDSCYALVLQSWSSLVLADKTSASGTSNEAATYSPKLPSTDRLASHVEQLESTVEADPDGSRTQRLNHHRSRAREDVLDGAAGFVDDGGGVATLTLPTGMGKTLSGLSAALEIRDRIDGDRVVYALPFTSIIDQVVDEIETIYRTDSTGRLLTAHHHLAETAIYDDSDDGGADQADRRDDIAGMLAESWRAGLTVSTFVQLFESLAGPRNQQSMKLPALRDSVVVLDEPQSLPLDWWKLVPRLVEILTEQYGATVIAMTATQPQLFEDATELTTDPDSYFDAVERVAYELDPSTERYIAEQAGAKSYGEAAAKLRESFEASDSALAVCNTIDSARELTDRVTDLEPTAVDVADAYTEELERVGDADAVDPAVVAGRVSDRGAEAVLHLSTRLRPVDRLTLIETAKELTDQGYPLVAVSTQLVEAGVDISFDRVYRDLAPVDSIVQAAGRCNRSFERDQGRVMVWWLDAPDEATKTPAEAVYNRGASLLPVVAETLADVRGESTTLSETDVARTAVTEYYERLHDDKNVGKDTYVEYVDDARAEELGDLSLIDQRRSADVLVCRTPEERQLARSIREADRNYEFDRLRALLDESKPLRLSVPYYREDSDTAEAIKGLPQLVEDEGLYELDVRDYGSYYDATTGFVVPGSTAGTRIL